MPNYMVDSVLDIDFTRLAREGITHIAIDVDSTLLEYGKNILSKPTRIYLRNHPDITRLCLATNRSRRDLDELARSINAAIVQAEGRVRKPRRLYFQKVIKQLGVPPGSIAMVGDKLFVDVYGGNRSGLKTVLVQRLGRDSWFERLIPFRALEQWLIKRLTKSAP